MCCAFAASAAAQASYTQLSPTNPPSARAGIHGVGEGSNLWIFGGLTGSAPTFSNEMWRFDGTAWTNLTPATSPSARDWYASAWDAARSRYVLFGGRTLNGTAQVDAGDTWEFDGASWTQSTPAVSPSARRWSAMVFDPTLGKCVLFGGSAAGTTFLGDTWTWDGGTWTQLAPVTSPSPRARGWLEWDSQRGRALYFGGKNTTAATALAETWSWNGSTWTQIVTSTQPGWNSGTGLIAYGMGYDVLRDRMVLMGGTRTTATVSAQTWEFDGSDWILRGTGPLPGRTGTALAFVLGQARTLVFGGSDGTNPRGDLWQYQTANWPGYTPVGTGCAGSAGTMTLTNGHAPWLGETHITNVGGIDPFGLCAMLVGLSTTSWSGGPLPFPLATVYGGAAPGCQLLVSADVTQILVNQAGTATFSLALPASPSWLGFPLNLQAAQLDPTLALSVSHAVALTVGAK
jgi:hypothetical protein